MEPNNVSNNENPHSSSQEFNKNKGRLARLSLAERQDIARKGGLARSERKRLSSQINAIKTGSSTKAISISTCDSCPSKAECGYYRKDMACQIELNLRRNIVRQYNAITGINPQDLLKEMFYTYKQLENLVLEKPSFYALLQLVYLQMQIYQMKFGKMGKKQGINIPIINASTEVKSLMKELRDAEN